MNTCWPQNASIFSELNWAVQSGVNGKLGSYRWNESVEFDSNGNINHAPSTTKELWYILSFLIYSFHPNWLTHYINPVLLDIIFMLIEKRKICKDNTTAFAQNRLLYVKRNSQNFNVFFLLLENVSPGNLGRIQACVFLPNTENVHIYLLSSNKFGRRP